MLGWLARNSWLVPEVERGRFGVGCRDLLDHIRGERAIFRPPTVRALSHFWCRESFMLV